MIFKKDQKQKKSNILGIWCGILILTALFCVAILTGCSKHNGNSGENGKSGQSSGKEAASSMSSENDLSQTSGPSQTSVPSPTPTPLPTPTPIPFVKQAYKTAGRDDVYLVSQDLPGKEWVIVNNDFSGEYALLWYSKLSSTDPDEIKDTVILIKPGVGTDEYRINPEYPFGGPKVLSDGTVILKEWVDGRLHIYDNTLTEVRSFVPLGEDTSSEERLGETGNVSSTIGTGDEITESDSSPAGDNETETEKDPSSDSEYEPETEKKPDSIGISENGIIWVADEKNARLVAIDLYGRTLGEYKYAPELAMISYLGSDDERTYFSAFTDDDYAVKYMYLPAGSDQIVYAGQNDSKKEDEEWTNYVTPVHEWEIYNATSTWFLFKPGYSHKGIVFPKNTQRERVAFMQGNMLCGLKSEWIGDSSCARELSMYDIENRAVSDVLKDSDLTGNVILNPIGMVGNGNILITAEYEDKNNELLLWTAGEKSYPIEGFCDLSKDDYKEYLADQIEELKDKYRVEITPDKTDDNAAATLEDIILEIDFVNIFKLGAKNDPELFTGEAETPIHSDDTQNAETDTTPRSENTQNTETDTTLRSENTQNTDTATIHPENYRNNEGAHYTFNPHVFSYFYLQEHGEKRRDALFAYIDALRAGEDRFRCSNVGEAVWAGGRLATYFYPVADLYAYAEYAGDGWANITYRIPKEEFLEKARDFEDRICGILNDVIEEDYSDIEKALALYEFMTEYCVYDYEMLDHNSEPEWQARQSGYRVLTEKQGICWEIACLYRYLLLQCGVEAEESIGAPYDENADLHEWNYITLNGQGYLIDATWGLSEYREPDLSYFLFTDEQRDVRDGFKPESFDIGNYGLYGARQVYSFNADDDRYSSLWGGKYIAFDQENNYIFYWDTEGKLQRFKYED